MSQDTGHTAHTTAVIQDDAPLPAVCVVSGEPATRWIDYPYALREPTYRVMLATGVFMGLFIATWMMVKVRPNITHELPAAVSFVLLFLATFAPVWLVASATSLHRGTLKLPICPPYEAQARESVRLTSKGDGKLALSGVHADFIAAASPSTDPT